MCFARLGITSLMHISSYYVEDVYIKLNSVYRWSNVADGGPALNQH